MRHLRNLRNSIAEYIKFNYKKKIDGVLEENKIVAINESLITH